ncbi:MAG: GSCFA domain-containing protein [Fibrobacter sp.]|nr:GSCFA domain-containing protein [Fibrobacter sp.]
MTPVSLMTIVKTEKKSLSINHNHSIMLIGSCFSEYIGEYLSENKFNICINPTGILYNLPSIQNALTLINSDKKFTDDDLYYYQELWRSWQHHTRFANPDKTTTLKMINDSLDNARKFFKSLDFLIITPGTSFVYFLKDTGKIIANCHRFPEKNFDRKLVTAPQIVEMFSDFFTKLFVGAPKAHVIFSVSPVRHLRDSSHENSVSKAHLITAIYELQQRFNKVSYFPAYEIMMDELRDYRFYDEDLVHPNKTAVTYIWDKFRDAYISEKSNEFIEQYAQIIASRKHRIQYPDSESTRSFAISGVEMVNKLSARFPEIDLTNDRDYFSQLM